MKRIWFLIVLLLFANNSYAKVDIYFGNGVWNFNEKSPTGCFENDAAECGRKALEEKLRQENILDNPNYPIIDTDEFGNRVTLQYNFGRGYMEDLLETYYQLRESGQLKDVGFFSFVYAAFTGDVPLAAAVLAAAWAPKPSPFVKTKSKFFFIPTTMLPQVTLFSHHSFCC